MDSSGANDSENGESWSSSEGEEQVVEISSHSRILISPRKVRGSSFYSKSSSRRLGVEGRNTTRSRQDLKSPRSQTSGRSVQVKKTGKSCWVGSPRKKLSDNQPTWSNNRNDISGSESEGSLDSGQEESDSSDAGEISIEAEVPVHRRSSKARQAAEKITRSSYKYREAASLDDSRQSLGSPTTPGKEMEELKATLKKLARDDDIEENPMMQKVPTISTATALHEYLTAATALGGVSAVDQTRPTDFTGRKGRHASFQPPRSSYMSTGSMKTKSKSMRARDSEAPGKLARKLDDPLSNPGERLSFTKKLFSTPPPPFGGLGKYEAGSSLLVPASSNSSVGAGAQGSRAMLSALKALQDKIGRLEQERESLMQQLSDVKVAARKRQAELASTEKKFSYELGQTKESARAAYDALRCDREELKLQLVKSEGRRKATQVELQHFQELAKNLSAKADDLQSQLQISESHRTRLKAEMKESNSNHSRAVNQLQAELTQLRQEHQAAAERNELLEAQFQRESSNHAESRERLKDSEQTVASISQLNEKLVAKVMEATEAANQAIKKNKKLQLQQRPSTLLRTTAASRASAAAASEALASRRAAYSTSAGGTQARTLKKKKASTGSASSTKKAKKAKSINNMTLLREANHGKEIPFLLGNSVQPSFSLIGNVQDALRRCDTTYVMPTLLSGAPTTPGSTSSRRQSARKVHTMTSVSDELNTPDADAMGQMSTPALAPPAASSTMDDAAQFSWTPKSTPVVARHRTKQKPPAIKVPTASPKAYASPMQSQIMEDLGAAVAAAEKEFQRLNKQYKDLVAHMEANNRRGTGGSEGGKAGGSTSAQLSQALGPLLDELEAKAKQLNLLKQVHQQAANSTINPPRHVVLSPEAIRRKTASLRVLNEYRQLESDSRNKGSGWSASPSSQLGANGFFR